MIAADFCANSSRLYPCFRCPAVTDRMITANFCPVSSRLYPRFRCPAVTDRMIAADFCANSSRLYPRFRRPAVTDRMIAADFCPVSSRLYPRFHCPAVTARQSVNVRIAMQLISALPLPSKMRSNAPHPGFTYFPLQPGSPEPSSDRCIRPARLRSLQLSAPEIIRPCYLKYLTAFSNIFMK